jgi:hypothetical protein
MFTFNPRDEQGPLVAAGLRQFHPIIINQSVSSVDDSKLRGCDDAKWHQVLPTFMNIDEMFRTNRYTDFIKHEY